MDLSPVSSLLHDLLDHSPSAPSPALRHRLAPIPPALSVGSPGYPDTRSFFWRACSVGYEIPVAMRSLLLAPEYSLCWPSHCSHLPPCPEVDPPCWRLVPRPQMQIALDQQVDKSLHAKRLSSQIADAQYAPRMRRTMVFEEGWFTTLDGRLVMSSSHRCWRFDTVAAHGFEEARYETPRCYSGTKRMAFKERKERNAVDQGGVYKGESLGLIPLNLESRVGYAIPDWGSLQNPDFPLFCTLYPSHPLDRLD